MKFWAAVFLVSALATGGIWWVSARGVPSSPSFTAASAQGDPVTVDDIGDQVQTRQGDALPVFAGTGDTAALYRFAKEQRDVLQWMPCACGCAKLGHTSNRSCYIKSESADHTTWTSHAAT
jgi:Protein of unknown function with PCYCGC motif